LLVCDLRLDPGYCSVLLRF